MQNLATANLVDAILKTRVPVDRLVYGWIRRHLFLRVRDVEDGPQDRSALRRLGIRTATDLEDAFDPGYAPGVFGSEAATEGQSQEYLALLRRVLNTEGDGLPSITESVRRTFSREPNLYHVRQLEELRMASLEEDERRETTTSPSAWARRRRIDPRPGAERRAPRKGDDRGYETHTEHEDHPWTRKIPDTIRHGRTRPCT